MLSLPCNNGRVLPRRSLQECKAAAVLFGQVVRKNKRRTHPHPLPDVYCAVCQQHTLVPSDIVNIGKTGLCGYCFVVEPAKNFVSEGQSFLTEDF